MVDDPCERVEDEEDDEGCIGNPATPEVDEQQGEACCGESALDEDVNAQSDERGAEGRPHVPEDAEAERVEDGMLGVIVDMAEILQILGDRIVAHGPGKMRDHPEQPSDHHEDEAYEVQAAVAEADR